MPDFGWGYPPGVSGNEPELTGEWPCYECGGSGGERDDPCPCCSATGIEPEEYPLDYLPFTERKAGKVDDGLNINLNHDRYFTRIVEDEEEEL